MILIRYILLIIIGYLIIKSFINYGDKGKSSAYRHEMKEKDKISPKKVSKGIGEYIEYEEIKK
jgi:hypothetical protein